MKMFKAEWKKVFSNKMLIGMMMIIPLVPIIYASIILSAYWDPFGNTSNLSVAVVNQDEPSELEGETLNIGDELIANLKENNDLDWHFVSQNEAQSGYENGDYYMVITIPEDFSKRASTVLEDNPEKMNLTYVVDPGRNFLSVTISEQAMNRINQEISDSVTKEYTRAIFSQINEIGKGFADAANGAEDINNGVEELSDANKEITESLNKLASSTLTFKNGTDDIQTGIGDFVEGTNELHSGATELNNGITKYTNGVSQLQEKLAPLSEFSLGDEDLSGGMDNLVNGSHNLNEGLVKINDQLPSNDKINDLTQGLSDIQQSVNQLQEVVSESDAPQELIEQVNALNEAVDQVHPKAIGTIKGYTNINQALTGDNGLIQGSSRLAGGIDNVINGKEDLTKAATKLSESLPQLVEAINELDSNSDNLREGSDALVAGTKTMSSQLPELANGVSQLVDGATELNEGAGQLADGSAKLGDGLVTLQEGTGELAVELSSGAETVDSIHTTDANYDMLASPITLTEEETSTVPNYGHALAPMFISLSLYIGALAFNLTFPLTGSAVKPTTGLSWWFSKFSLGFVPAVGGALILVVIVVYGMGLDVANMGQFILISILGSLTYMFLMMLLAITMDNAGRFIGMILLVFQLAASGGMIPVVLQNDFFSAVNPYMPMTYVIYGLREAMTSSIGNATFILSVVFLIGCIFLFNLFIWLYLHIRNKREIKLALES